MMRNLLLCGLMVSMMTWVGCAKSEGDPPRAETAKAGLMPIVDTGFETTYITDQKQISMAGEVKVSLEPLESFRGRKIERAKPPIETEASGEAAATEEDEWDEEGDAWGDEEETEGAATESAEEEAAG